MARASMFASISLVLLAMTAKAIDLEPGPGLPDLPVAVDYFGPSTFDDEYYLGCYVDTWDHILQDMYYASETAMTIGLCRSQAQLYGVQFYGLKGGYECFGGNNVARLMSPGGGCNTLCSGDPSEICGGSEAVSVYITPRRQSPPPPRITPGCYVGCFADMANNRTLANLVAESDEMTIDSCRKAARAQGYAYFGVEAGRQCFVGNEIAPPRTDPVTCDYRCAGDASQICGGDWAISVYNSYDPTSLASPRPPPPSLRKQDYLGCFTDVVWMRALPQQLDVSDNMTIAACRNKALEAGLTLYGVEAGRECWGGSDRSRAMGWGRNRGCNWTCGGADCEVCGGDLAIDIYTVHIYPEGDPSTLHPPEIPSWPGTEPPHHWDFWPSGPESTFPSYPEPSDYPDLSPPVYETMPPSPPVYGTTPPSYGTAPPLPTAEAFLLPEDLRPESAYFDARSGLSIFSVPGYEDGTVLLWEDVLLSERPGNLHFFTGSCGAVPEDELGGPAIRMDGMSCVSVMEGSLPNWDTSDTGAFTAVWIGRFADSNSGNQTIMTLSRTPYDYNREFLWTTDYFFTYSFATGYGNGLSQLPAIPAGQWTMQVISRKPSPRWGLTSLSYYSYGQSSGFYKAKSLGSGCGLDPDSFTLGMDDRDHNKAFKGDLAVVLMYNRTLSERQVRNLITFYQARFGWGTPRA
ncbi:hypothetical protein Vretimale_13082 [Volvox reticuliferus]|uniref:WSC domain-containing protein n=1 Tax=Volvox reticuliferus TaxID=1737510 RepID=A0A8J4CQ72_9CHLO|nr:hypothetical protein Vretifemale_15797 [Volvox reticuliferus]GIM09188.1 hypothetical protein Vretimale_13082 [Volvox reticuliferus]